MHSLRITNIAMIHQTLDLLSVIDQGRNKTRKNTSSGGGFGTLSSPFRYGTRRSGWNHRLFRLKLSWSGKLVLILSLIHFIGLPALTDEEYPQA